MFFCVFGKKDHFQQKQELKRGHLCKHGNNNGVNPIISQHYHHKRIVSRALDKVFKLYLDAKMKYSDIVAMVMKLVHIKDKFQDKLLFKSLKKLMVKKKEKIKNKLKQLRKGLSSKKKSFTSTAPTGLPTGLSSTPAQGSQDDKKTDEPFNSFVVK